MSSPLSVCERQPEDHRAVSAVGFIPLLTPWVCSSAVTSRPASVFTVITPEKSRVSAHGRTDTTESHRDPPLS